MRAAGLQQTAASWARLRAVLVVCFPDDCDRVGGMQLSEGSEREASRWMEQGQLHQQVVSGSNPATVLNHVARRLRKNPPLRVRFGARLLADAARLAAD